MNDRLQTTMAVTALTPGYKYKAPWHERLWEGFLITIAILIIMASVVGFGVLLWLISPLCLFATFGIIAFTWALNFLLDVFG